MASADTVIQVAGIYINETNGTVFGAPASADWCCYFVSHIFRMADVSVPGLPDGYCPTALAAQRKAGLEVAVPRPGCIVYFDWNANGQPNHVGIVESVNGSTIYTIEGNTSNGTNSSIVARHSYPLDSPYILTYIQPIYSYSIEELIDMQFICQPDELDLMVYYDGTELHDCTNPDDITAINMAYEMCHGVGIPIFKMGTKDAPWFARFVQAAHAKAPSKADFPSLYAFEPRSGWKED